MIDNADRQRRVVIDNDRGDRTLWLLLALGIGVALIAYRWPRFALAAAAALAMTIGLYKLGLV